MKLNKLLERLDYDVDNGREMLYNVKTSVSLRRYQSGLSLSHRET